MKIKNVKSLKFKPVDVRITFENADELGEFYALFNYTPITECLRHLDAYVIREELDVPLEVYEGSHARLRNNLQRV